MKKRIVLALPMFLILGWIAYILITDWSSLSLSNLLMIPIVIIFAIHFIFMQLTSSFVDILDAFKVKKITQETLPNLQKGRKILGGICILLLLLLFAKDFIIK